jgi:hypothetical protein
MSRRRSENGAHVKHCPCKDGIGDANAFGQEWQVLDSRHQARPLQTVPGFLLNVLHFLSYMLVQSHRHLDILS